MSKNGNNKGEGIRIEQVRDVNNRQVFKNHTLCAQFLRDYAGLDILKNVQPEDIEDVTEKYQAYLGVEFETDTVKRIHLPEPNENMPLYMVSLIEHKSDVDYNVSMQLLRYMVCIWDDYAKTVEKEHPGSSKNKGFRYPPIFPIVYYEGAGEWTASMNVRARIFMNEIFASYIPEFTYRLVNVHQYTNEELLIHEDEMSLLMMINRIQTPQDFTDFINTNQGEICGIVERASENIVQIIVNALWALFMKMQVSVSEATDCIRKVIGGDSMGNWFENMEPMDIQAERENTRKEKERADQAEAERSKAEAERDRAREDLQEAIEKNISSTIKLIQEFSGTKQMAVDKLVKLQGMSRSDAEKLVEKYWS